MDECCDCLKADFKLSFNDNYYSTGMLSADIFSNESAFLFNENGTGVCTIYSTLDDKIGKKTREFVWTYVGLDKISILYLDRVSSQDFTFGENALIYGAYGIYSTLFIEAFLRDKGYGEKLNSLNK